MPLVSHKDLSGLLNVEASEAELMHPVGLGSMGWVGIGTGAGRETLNSHEVWCGVPQGRTM